MKFTNLFGGPLAKLLQVLFLNHSIISPVWVQAPHWPYVRQTMFCWWVCQVVFLVGSPVFALLPIGLSQAWLEIPITDFFKSSSFYLIITSTLIYCTCTRYFSGKKEIFTAKKKDTGTFIILAQNIDCWNKNKNPCIHQSSYTIPLIGKDGNDVIDYITCELTGTESIDTQT